MQIGALIVDNDSKACNLVGDVLHSLGIGATTLATSSEALEICRRQRFLVAFVGSPSASPEGAEVTRQLRSTTYNSGTPIVQLSADVRPRAMAEAFAAGATFFLYKPVDKTRLFRLVRSTHAAMQHELMRRTRRVPFTSGVRLNYHGQEIEGETVNASLEGVLIKAAQPIPIGSSVDVSLHFGHESRPLRTCGAVVRHSASGEMGIHFARLKAGESQRLEEFLLAIVQQT